MQKQVITIISSAVMALILLVTVGGCGGPTDDKEVVVGNKNFTEQCIIGEMMKQLLEDRGFRVELKSGRSSDYLREAIEFGDIDIYAEYTGTAWMVHLGHKYEPGTDSKEVYNKVKEEDESNGLDWLNPIWNNNTYALASWTEFVEEYHLKTLSDLASLYRKEGGKIRTFVGLEFATRPDGLPGLESHYDFKVAVNSLLIERVWVPLEVLKKHECDVAMVFGTDAAIAEHGWYVYADDKAFFPPYDLTPCVRKEVLDKYPETAVILNELVATFPDKVAECQKVWQQLNAKVDIDLEKDGKEAKTMKPDEVAREYLLKHGLIKE